MITNNKKNIIFENNKGNYPLNILEEILKTNGLEESPIDFLKKTDTGKVPWLNTLYKLARSLASEEINEENFKSSVTTQLGVTQQVAENILKEIKEKLMPLARTLDEDDLVKDEIINTPSQKINAPASTSGKNNINISGSEIPANEPLETPPTNIAPTTPRKTKKVSTVITENPKQSSGPDSYREPIE